MLFSNPFSSKKIQSCTRSFPLRRHRWSAEGWLTYVTASHQALLASRESFLHTTELAIFEQIRYPRKQKQYLQGRYVAKQALAHYTGECDLTQLVTRSGVFQQPLVSYAKREMPAISIAHTKSLAACLVFPQDHPMGLDIEPLQPAMNVLASDQLTSREKVLFHQTEEDVNCFCTRLWSMKEALGKTLTTGLTAPLWIYEVNELDECQGHTVCTFTHFAQYKALSFFSKGCYWAIVLPKNTEHMPLIEQFITAQLL